MREIFLRKMGIQKLTARRLEIFLITLGGILVLLGVKKVFFIAYFGYLIGVILICNWADDGARHRIVRFRGNFSNLAMLLGDRGFKLKKFSNTTFMFMTNTKFLPKCCCIVDRDRGSMTITGPQGFLQQLAEENNHQFELIQEGDHKNTKDDNGANSC